MKEYAEQYYVFTGPDGWAWCEMFYGTNHVTAPTPCREVADALELLTKIHPDAMVDALCYADDMIDAMRFSL